MGTGQQAKFIGHGIGLEINEAPVLAPRIHKVNLESYQMETEPNDQLAKQTNELRTEEKRLSNSP